MQPAERSRSESLYWPTIWAVGLHILIFGMLFVSFANTPDLPPSKPIVQATLYQLKSQSQATTQTNQKIAGEAQKTSAKQYEAEQMEQRKVEQQKQAVAAKAAEQKRAEDARKAEAAKADAAQKAAAAKQAQEAKKEAEQKQQADLAKKKAAEVAKQKAAEEAKKKAAAEEAKKKAAADAAKKKAEEEAKKKAAAEAAKKKAAAEEAKKKAAADAARKAAEDKKAQALAELLSDDTQRQQALADTQGSQVAGNFDDLIRMRAAENWTRPPSARKGMSVTLRVNMLPDGTVTAVNVIRSSNDSPFDSSAVAAVKNIGRLTEMQGLSAQEFQPYRSFTMTFTPEDLAL